MDTIGFGGYGYGLEYKEIRKRVKVEAVIMTISDKVSASVAGDAEMWG
ncbi:MAG: hypothetical protein QXM16_09285 [Nitrososphaerota archaeon]